MCICCKQLFFLASILQDFYYAQRHLFICLFIILEKSWGAINHMKQPMDYDFLRFIDGPPSEGKKIWDQICSGRLDRVKSLLYSMRVLSALQGPLCWWSAAFQIAVLALLCYSASGLWTSTQTKAVRMEEHHSMSQPGLWHIFQLSFPWGYAIELKNAPLVGLWFPWVPCQFRPDSC